jgi:hypothetical protein
MKTSPSADRHPSVWITQVFVMFSIAALLRPLLLGLFQCFAADQNIYLFIISQNYSISFCSFGAKFTLVNFLEITKKKIIWQIASDDLLGYCCYITCFTYRLSDYTTIVW